MARAAASKIEDEGGQSAGGARARGFNVATTRILDVLSQFALVEPQFGVTELSQQLGMTKNMVHRALATLVDQGYLVRDLSGRRYELGYKVLELQNPNFPAPDIRTIARPYLERLHALTGQTAQLTVRAGDGQVVIDGVEGRGQIVTRTKLGQYFPLHASSASRAILAAMSDADVDAYIKRNAPLPRFTENTLTEPAALKREIAGIRARGYAESFEDYNRGSYGLAFALPATDGTPHGAAIVGGPLHQFTPARAREFLPLIEKVIDELRNVARLYDPM
jgi:DNA-binding IclR family transcriptional regulator